MAKEVKVTAEKTVTLPAPFIYTWPGIKNSADEQGRKLCCKEFRKAADAAGFTANISQLSCIDVKLKSKVTEEERYTEKEFEESDIDLYYRNKSIEKKLDKKLEEMINDELLKDEEVGEKVSDIYDGHIRSSIRACVVKYNNRGNNPWNVMYTADHSRNLDFLPEDLIESVRKELGMILSENYLIVNNKAKGGKYNVRNLRYIKFTNEDGEYVQFVVSSESKGKESGTDENKTVTYSCTLPQFEAAGTIEEDKFTKVCKLVNRYVRDLLIDKEYGKFVDYTGTVYTFRSVSEVEALVSEQYNKAEKERKLAEKAAKAKDAAEKKASKKKKSVEEKAAEEVAANESNDEEQPQEVDAFDVFPSEE